VAIARCHLIVRDVAAAGVAVAPHGMAAAMAFEALAQGQPVGNPVPFDTEASRSGNKWGSSETRGLHGTRQKFDDGSIVIDATEALSATRSDGLDATLSATQHRVEKDDVVAVVQMNYSYRNRTLPNAMLMRVAGDFPAQVPAGFTATVVRSVGASQFGKKDREDEGTGSPLMGLIQTNSDVFGASIKASAMARAFGAGWKANPQRLNALIEVLFPARNRLVRVPLVDVGPHEDTDERSYPEVDLTLSCDEFLGTHGQARVKYRILLPS
jgi:hypothetical protein